MDLFDSVLAVVQKYNYLMNGPKTKENVQGYVEILVMKKITVEQFQKGFLLAINENSEKFPSAKDIEDQTTQKRIRYTENDIYEKMDTEELKNINRWCAENFGGLVPRPNSWEGRNQSQESWSRAMVNRGIAVNAFYKAVRNKEIDYEKVASGEHFLLIEQQKIENALMYESMSGMDLSKIGKGGIL